MKIVESIWFQILVYKLCPRMGVFLYGKVFVEKVLFALVEKLWLFMYNMQ
jgi:hypothetical protein